MKLAIHSSAGSFSGRWIAYCDERKIPYKVVNCYDSNIVEQLSDCDALLFHHHHGDYRDVQFAKQLLYSLEIAGKKVFPNFATNWHFDDKVGQKYLLEAIGAPLVPSYVFYEKAVALTWVTSTSFPKVFKLRGGAGSANVRLVKDEHAARRIINKAFGRGFPAFDRIGYLKDRFLKYKSGEDTKLGVMKGVGRLFFPTKFSKMRARDKGYAYFQDFIPGNKFDTRVVVVGQRAFALVRMVREGDFRASGSGKISYDLSPVKIEMVEVAFRVNDFLKTQSIAFDFVLENGKPLIVEISYGYAVEAYDDCPGYWDRGLTWHEGKFNPQEWMIENLIEDLKNNSNQ